jgi:hypothetical protein
MDHQHNHPSRAPTLLLPSNHRLSRAHRQSRLPLPIRDLPSKDHRQKVLLKSKDHHKARVSLLHRVVAVASNCGKS